MPRRKVADSSSISPKEVMDVLFNAVVKELVRQGAVSTKGIMELAAAVELAYKETYERKEAS